MYNDLSKKPVSIAVGIICNGSILFAADGQTTGEFRKDLTTNKLHGIKFKDSSVIVAEAGDASRSQRALEFLELSAIDEPISDYRTAADRVSDAMLKLRVEMRRQRADCSQDELDDYINKRELNCWLMVGHYFQSNPLIFTANLSTGAANKMADLGGRHYATIGTGCGLANYLLSEHSHPQMDFNSAVAMAVYVVEEVKKHDPYCGGQTRFAFLAPHVPETPLLLPLPMVDDIAREMADFNKATQGQRQKELAQKVNQIVQKWALKYPRKPSE